MESPRKFNDCYFYYYSTCTKGDNCVFRHEPSALGCETMCTAWQQGKCLDKHCKLRHMELRKNRKQIPCYWENQPGGCRKKHCPFMHKNPDARTDGIAPSQPGPIATSPTTSSIPEASAEQAITGVPTPNVPPPASVPSLWAQRHAVLDSATLGVLPSSSELLLGRRVVAHGGPLPHAHAVSHAAHAPLAPLAPLPMHEPTYAPLPVDPLVVNFEEESDSESAPCAAPAAPQLAAKSLELLLLERIQAEAAALYGYDAPCAADKGLDFRVLSLDEIRARRRPNELTLSRKRRLPAHDALAAAGGNIVKLVRSNCVVYRQVGTSTPAPPPTRQRTLSEPSDACELRGDCYELKRIQVDDGEPAHLAASVPDVVASCRRAPAS